MPTSIYNIPLIHPTKTAPKIVFRSEVINLNTFDTGYSFKDFDVSVASSLLSVCSWRGDLPLATKLVHEGEVLHVLLNHSCMEEVYFVSTIKLRKKKKKKKKATLIIPIHAFYYLGLRSAIARLTIM